MSTEEVLNSKVRTLNSVRNIREFRGFWLGTNELVFEKKEDHITVFFREGVWNTSRILKFRKSADIRRFRGLLMYIQGPRNHGAQDMPVGRLVRKDNRSIDDLRLLSLAEAILKSALRKFRAKSRWKLRSTYSNRRATSAAREAFGSSKSLCTVCLFDKHICTKNSQFSKISRLFKLKMYRRRSSAEGLEGRGITPATWPSQRAFHARIRLLYSIISKTFEYFDENKRWKGELTRSFDVLEPPNPSPACFYHLKRWTTTSFYRIFREFRPVVVVVQGCDREAAFVWVRACEVIPILALVPNAVRREKFSVFWTVNLPEECIESPTKVVANAPLLQKLLNWLSRIRQFDLQENVDACCASKWYQV